MKDLKCVYQASTKQHAELKLDRLEKLWERYTPLSLLQGVIIGVLLQTAQNKVWRKNTP